MDISAKTKLGSRLVVLGLFVLVSGCSSPANTGQPTETPIYQVKLSKAQTLHLARNVLLGYQFRIMKEDASAGTLRTYPLSGAQFFEFWRRDGRGSFSALESNLHSVQRIVEITLWEQAPGTAFSCVVRAERLSVPGHGIESDSQAYRMLSDSSRSLQKLKLTPYQQRNMEWIDLGLDWGLSEDIATEIVRKAGRQTVREERSLHRETQG